MEIPFWARTGISVIAVGNMLGCQATGPETTPTPTSVTKTAEVLDPTLLRTVQERVFRLDDYTLNLRQKMRGFWTQGVGLVEYSTRDGKKYLLSSTQAQTDDKLRDWGKTTITLQRKNLSSGGSALVFSLAGKYNPLVEDKRLTPDAQTKLQSMNIDHETLVSIAAIHGLIALGEGLGLNFSWPSEKTADEDGKLLQIIKSLPVTSPLAEAVAEINDYILTYPLLDKDSQGNPLFVKVQGEQDTLPVIQNRAVLEGGLTFIVDSSIGLSLRQFSSWEELSRRYPRLQDIPNYQEYLTKIKAHYSTVYR